MKQLQALLIGQSYELTMAALPLLKRSNFEVDLIAIGSEAIQSDLLRKVHSLDSINLLAKLLLSLSVEVEYDVVVVGDDATLLDILKLNISDDVKTKFLPITSLDKAGHLYSKIGLSKLLHESKVNTPIYGVAECFDELLSCSNKIGYPLMLKIDSSGGGAGVFECHSDVDVLSHKEKLSYPIIIQKWVEGDTLDLSAFYQNGELVHFTYSKFEKVIGGKYGPSSLRRYWQLACVEGSVFEELRVLGKTLGADGFVNVTAIDSVCDSKRYYFEADMRPNVWVDYGKFIGNDSSIALRDYFSTGQPLTCPQPFNAVFSDSALIPYLPRLTLLEVFLNKYDCWSYLPGNLGISNYLVASSLQGISVLASRIFKPYVPNLLWLRMRFIYRKYLLSWVRFSLGLQI